MINLRPRNPQLKNGTRIPVLRICAALCLALIGSLWGCSNTTDPGGGDDPILTIGFVPLGQGQSLKLSETMDFKAVLTGTGDLTVNWYRGGSLVGQDSVLVYEPQVVGKDTLQVSAFVDAVRDTYYWVITVEEDESSLPPVVPNVAAEAGPLPVEVAVSWLRVTNSTFPVVDYLVAVSFDGPINEDNWDQATILGNYPPVPGDVGFRQIYTEQDHGMRPGELAWFAVRARDDRQQLSPLTNSVQHEITWPWYLQGTVSDDAGLPLSVVGVSAGAASANTDGRGVYFFNEPFRSIDSVRISTSSSGVYNFKTPPVIADQETTTVNITLINRYPLGDPSCWTGEFIEYLRIMTRTKEVPGVPAESQLFKWAEYPISVFIPPGVSDSGVDLEQASLAALDFLNLTMRNDADLLGIEETDYLVRTTDEVAADIVFLFEWRVQNYGSASLLLPVGRDLGEVIPIKMQIWINTTADLSLFSQVQGVALHEIGHTLGLLDHSDCPTVEHLMAPAGGGDAMDRLEPIHLDERRALRAIRLLPQGVNMAEFYQGRIAPSE